MIDMKELDNLAAIADEMLAGLHADDAIKRRVKAAALEKRRRKMPAYVPAMCALAIVLMAIPKMNKKDGPVNINTIAAGDEQMLQGRMVADLGEGAQVRTSVPNHHSLFATHAGDIPLVTLDGAVYRMLEQPGTVGDELLGAELGTIAVFTQEPSLASGEEMQAGVSNVAQAETAVYEVAGLEETTAVAAQVGEQMRLFQRVSYAGKGPGSQTLADTFSVRGQVDTLELSGVGVLTGDAANDVIDILLDQAVLKSADASARKQSLTVTLTNGLKLQLGVSGDTLCGCGGWSCPEFFEAFEAAL